jgi:hypothetical protein
MFLYVTRILTINTNKKTENRCLKQNNGSEFSKPETVLINSVTSSVGFRPEHILSWLKDSHRYATDGTFLYTRA